MLKRDSETRNRVFHKTSVFLVILLVLLFISSIFLAACQPSSAARSEGATPDANKVTRTATPRVTRAASVTPVPQITNLPTDTPDEITQNCCADYRLGLLQAPATFNYWRYLAEDNSPWTGLVIGDEAPSLFTFPALHHSRRLDFVPALAADLPPAAEQRGDLWVIPVKMISSAAWSDGEPITAHDVAFTIQTVFDLQLGGGWADFYPLQSLAKAEAQNDHTVVFYFYSQPGLSEWQFAVAMGPILPEHYWAEYVDQARTYIEGIDPPETCQGNLTLEQVSACQAYASARQLLFKVEPVSPPSGGGYVTAGKTSGSTLRRAANPNFFATGIKIMEFADGTWSRVFTDGTLQQFYGDAEEDPLVSYHRGPFSRSIEFKIYASYREAANDLFRGRIDAVLNPDGQTDDWLNRTTQAKTVEQVASPQNGLAYLAFNLRRSPGALPEFRQAVEILVDRQQIAEKDLENLAYPAYSIIPPANVFWWDPSLTGGDEALSGQARLELAVEMLKEAGWTWKTEPSWNASTRQVIPGEEIRLPDGQLLPEISFIYPLPEENLLMSTYGEVLTEVLRGLGVLVLAEPLPRAQMINRTLIAGGSFDLYILDWRFPLYPGFLCDLFTSSNDTLLTGGYNTTGYSSPRFDETCESFLAENEVELAQDQAHRMQSQLAFDRPYLPLYYPKLIDLMTAKVNLPFEPRLDGVAGQNGFQADARVLIK